MTYSVVKILMVKRLDSDNGELVLCLGLGQRLLADICMFLWLHFYDKQGYCGCGELTSSSGHLDAIYFIHIDIQHPETSYHNTSILLRVKLRASYQTPLNLLHY